MATYQAISAVGLALVGMLKDASAGTEFAGQSFELYQSGDFRTAPQSLEGLTFYLYRVAVNSSVRNLPPTTAPDGRRFRPPVPLDLYYLLTPWGRSAAMQHRVLGWAMRELQNLPILPAALLNHYTPEGDTFRPAEAVQLICESLSAQEMMNVLDPIDLKQQLSVSYVARTILLESTLPLTEAGPVQTRAFDYGEVRER